MENPNLVEFEIHDSNFKADFCNPNFKQGVIPYPKFFPCNPIIPKWLIIRGGEANEIQKRIPVAFLRKKTLCQKAKTFIFCPKIE